jgi:hypothetical protein
LRALALACLIASTASADELDHRWEVGARLRAIFITPDMIRPFATTNSSLDSLAVGVELVHRRANYDVVASLDFGFIDFSDGNFLGAGRDPTQDTHYFQFGNFGQLTFISADVSIIGHTAFGKYVELRYGAGLGLGGFTGQVHMINNGRQCTQQNYLDGSQCYPHTPDGRVDIPLGRADTQAKLLATQDPSKIDLADDPHFHVSNDVPPVIPVINVILGLRFKLGRHAAFDIEGGFRDLFFLGGNLHVLF